MMRASTQRRLIRQAGPPDENNANMADDMKRRREIARQAFAARRGELGLTQEQVARRGEIVVRTVQNFEAGKWPNARSRARLERAVDWPLGEIARLAGGEPPDLDPQLVELASQLSDAEAEALIDLLRSRRSADPGQSQPAAANG